VPDSPTALPMLPPGVDPADYYAQMRKQMMAEALTKLSLSPPQPVNYGPIRSRLTAVTPLAQMFAAKLAGKNFDEMAQLGTKNQLGMLNAFSNGAGGGGGDPSSAVPDGGAPSPPPAPSPEPPPNIALPPDQMPPSPAPSPGPPPAPVPGAAPNMPGGGVTPPGPFQGLNPLHLHPALAAATYMRDPAKYAELVAGTPEWRTALAGTNGNVAQAQHLVVAKLIKDGTIELRQGGEAIIHNPDGTITRLRNPNLINGVEPTYGPQGQVTGSFVIPGMQAAERAIESAKHTGEAEGSIHDLPTPGGSRPQFGLGGIPGAPSPVTPAGPPGAPNANLPTGATGAAGTGPGGSGSRRWFAPPAAPNAPNEPVPANVSPWVAKLPVRQDLNVGLGHDTFAEKRIEYQAQKANELQDKYGAEADLADQRMAFNQIVLQNLPRAETGPLADFLTTIRAEAAQLGVPTSIIPGWATAAPTIEMRKALVRNAIVTLKPNFGGRPAASEFQVLKEEANPSPEMTALAIKRLTEIDMQLATMQKQRAADFDWAIANNKDPARFESLYATHNPALQSILHFLHPPTFEQLQAEKARRQRAPPPPAVSAPPGGGP